MTVLAADQGIGYAFMASLGLIIFGPILCWALAPAYDAWCGRARLHRRIELIDTMRRILHFLFDQIHYETPRMRDNP